MTIGPRDVDALLPLTFSRPGEALAKARAVLAGRPGPYDASVAHQAAGIVLREFGDVEAGVRELRAALRLARRISSAEREADVLATLGVALIYTGKTTAGLAALDQALDQAQALNQSQSQAQGGRRSSGVLVARVLLRRGIALWTLGRYAAALDDLRQAVVGLRRAGDLLWTARALNARAMAYLAVGSTSRADADFATAGQLSADSGQELEAVYALHNRGLTAFASGDLTSALSHLDAATSHYRTLQVSIPPLIIDRCAVLLAAGLARAALAEAEAAVRSVRARAAGELGRLVGERLASLAMAGARLEVRVAPGGTGEPVELALGANVGEPVQPLARAASGGELARAMLAIRLVGLGGPQTMVFDEVDAGVGGAAALALGEALHEVGRQRQVLVVTHLAQVASQADAQISVVKQESRGRTVTTALTVSGEDRVTELSRMLSGHPGSDVARAHARELLGVSHAG